MNKRQASKKEEGPMETIYFVGGSKGGVGKSIVTMALLDYLKSSEANPLLIESDTSNPDVEKCYKDEVPHRRIGLDDGDGWVDLINEADSFKGGPIVVNTAARNNTGVGAYGATLRGALGDLKRKFVTLWVINRQRDSLELLKQYQETFPTFTVHVIRNTYFGPESKFELYNNSAIRKQIEEAGGLSLNFPDLADRVSDDLYSKRLSIAKAGLELPIGNRAELNRWRSEAAKVFAAVVKA